MKRIGILFTLFILLFVAFPLDSFAKVKPSDLTYNEAVALYKKGNYDDAFVKFIEEIKANPKNQLAKFYLGEIFFEKKDFKTAIDCYKSANYGFHKYAMAYYKCGLCYYQLTEYKNAKIMLGYYFLPNKKQVKDADVLANAYYVLGESYLKTNKKYLAMDCFKKALTFEKDNYLANKALGQWYYGFRRYDLALYYLTQAADIKKEADVLKTIGQIYLKKGDEVQAKPYLLESYSLNNDDKQDLDLLLRANLVSELKNIICANTSIPIVNEKAPEALHKLVETEWCPDKAGLAKLHNLIDLIWNDKEGKILLKKVISNELPICLSSTVKHSSVSVPDYSIFINDAINNQVLSYHPQITWDFLKISIKEEDLKGLNKNHYLYTPISIMVHELCHAAYRTNFYMTEDTKEEEFLCYMIGSNVAHRIIYGRSLNKEETINQALWYAPHVNKNYSKLKDSSNFVSKIRNIGIEPPNYELYSNFYTDNSKSDNHDVLTKVPTILKSNWKYENTNSALTAKFAFLIDKNANISNILLIKTSGNKQYDTDCLEVLKKSSPISVQGLDISNDYVSMVLSFNNGDKTVSIDDMASVMKPNKGEPDFGTYMKRLQKKIKSNWSPPKGKESNKIVLKFTVLRDGNLSEIKVIKTSNDRSTNGAAIRALVMSAPFEPLPKEYKGKSVDIEFTFDYNVFYNSKF